MIGRASIAFRIKRLLAEGDMDAVYLARHVYLPSMRLVRTRMTSLELRAALIAAFPPLPITHATIHTADARWASYEERDALPLIEGKSWVELEREILERHAALLVYAGGALYRAILPAYLLVIVEHEYYTSLPFHVGRQLTYTDSNVDREIFNERVGPMTAEQRDVVRHAIAMFAEQVLLREVGSIALRSW